MPFDTAFEQLDGLWHFDVEGPQHVTPWEPYSPAPGVHQQMHHFALPRAPGHCDMPGFSLWPCGMKPWPAFAHKGEVYSPAVQQPTYEMCVKECLGGPKGAGVKQLEKGCEYSLKCTDERLKKTCDPLLQFYAKQAKWMGLKCEEEENSKQTGEIKPPSSSSL
eukprot:gnl/MRDRNA2_/MRDRNA2_66519_c0_seq1.p1 gnl/MRDRNA2_/MRDRNA2_66519_c0~~gnl/MRDRNA2_/MRDRNA2_66519_c0_seq1.p1  ORF type:complete len:163 (+),score=18.37 gnl/MRDRNA2_/MRDRNA2_66519_c0_seq1:108-596(+)